MLQTEKEIAGWLIVIDDMFLNEQVQCNHIIEHKFKQSFYFSERTYSRYYIFGQNYNFSVMYIHITYY